MRVEVADNGNARVLMHGGETIAIRRDGILYLIRGDEEGYFALPWEEFTRVEAGKERLAGAPFDFADLPPARIVECGAETVAGRVGRVLTLMERNETDCDPRFGFVVNSDPDLAPIGPLLGMIFGRAGLGVPHPLGDLMREIHSRGTLIRNFMLRLESTSSTPIPVEAFELPGPVLSGEEAEARLGPAW